MKNITVSVNDEVYKRARIVAAERETSVSAMVRDFLSSLSGEESEFERKKKLESQTREQILNFDASQRLMRDELHDRKR